MHIQIQTAARLVDYFAKPCAHRVGECNMCHYPFFKKP